MTALNIFVQVTGLVVADYGHEHSHWNSKGSLSDWLKQEGIPAISGIDTRAVTKVKHALWRPSLPEILEPQPTAFPTTVIPYRNILR